MVRLSRSIKPPTQEIIPSVPSLFLKVFFLLLLTASVHAQTATNTPTNTETNTPTVTPTIPALNFGVADVAIAPSAQAGGLIAFGGIYGYGNVGSSNVTIFTTVPSNTTLVEVGPNANASGVTANGSPSGSPVTWVFPGSTYEQTGTVYMLVQVNGGTPQGTTIQNAMSLSVQSGGSMTSNYGTAVVGANLSVTKSQSTNVANLGDSVTFTIDWNVSGESLNLMDTYNYDTSGSSVFTGFDGTSYNAASTPGGSSLGSWIVTYDPAAFENVIVADGGGFTPFLLRSNPTLKLLNGNYAVYGNMYLDPSNTPNPNGGLVLAWDPSNGNGYVLGLSASATPANLYLVKYTNNVPSIVGGINNAFLPDPIQTGAWYNAEAFVGNQGGSSVTILAKVWRSGQGQPANWPVSITDTPAFNLSNNYQIGWQAVNGVGGFDNLLLYTPNGAVSMVIDDTLPVGLTYVSANPAPSQIAPFVMWNFPGTTYGGNGSFTISALVSSACVSLTNTSGISAGNGNSQTSNPVTMTINCVNTPTNSPTNTSTNSPTQTPTLTATNSPTLTPTLTSTKTATNTPTITPTPTPTGSMTATPTPNVALYLDVNYFNPQAQSLGMDVRIDQAGQVKVMVFNIAAEEVEKLVDQQMTPGNYRFSWDGRNSAGDVVANGVYFIVIQQPSGKMVRKVIVLK